MQRLASLREALRAAESRIGSRGLSHWVGREISDQLTLSWSAEASDDVDELITRLIDNTGSSGEFRDTACALIARRTENPHDSAAGAGLLYLATMRDDFNGADREQTLADGVAAFGLSQDLVGIWGQDGQSTKYPERDSEWAQDINFRNLCLLELRRPGAMAALATSPFRLRHPGRYSPDDLTEQYDRYVQMLEAQRTGTVLPPTSYSLIETADSDWVSSDYPDEAGDPRNTVGYATGELRRISTPMFAEFQRTSDIVGAVRMLAGVHGAIAETAETGQNLLLVIVINTHANSETLLTSLDGGRASVITADMTERYPAAVFESATRLGLRDLVVTGCEAGESGGFVQRLSARLQGVTCHGSSEIDALEDIRVSGSDIRTSYVHQGEGVRYKNGLLLDNNSAGLLE